MSYISDDDYISADENVESFDIYKKCITKKDDKTLLVELSFRDLLNYSKSWNFNRKIVEDKTSELYDTLCIDYDIPWTLHAIYDTSIKNNLKNILILDGQHRKKAIEYYIQNHDIEMKCDRKVWVWLYIMEHSEANNSSVALELFKKINNNRQIEMDEYPNLFVIDLVKHICNNNVLIKGIKTNEANNTSHVPYIHQKELNTFFNENIQYLTNMSYEEIINNILHINNILSLKSYEQLYGKQSSFHMKHKRAVEIQFFLNLGKKSKYPIKYWIQYIKNIKDFQ